MPARPAARRNAWILALILPSLIVAQSNFRYSDAKGDLSINARDGQGEITKEGWKFDLKGNVTISSRTERFTLSAPQVSAIVAATRGSSSPNQMKTARATGGVKVTQSTPSSTANLQAQTATYTAGTRTSTLQVQGSVRIQNIDTQKRETLVATGANGTAILNPNAKRGLDSATLNGPVRVEVLQAGSGGGKAVFTGQKLTMNQNQITLTGNVKATGSGSAQFGNLSNVDSVTVDLNDKGEMSRFRFRSGGGS